MYRRSGTLFTLLCLLIAIPCPLAQAQGDLAPCGYIDDFAFPVTGIDINHTDFAIYRTRFGGLHTGIDVAFDDLGAPVRAAARGRVTYSDLNGWDTEKGVVVIQHTLPDGTLVNTLYGHMEELNGYTFPPLDACVEQGQIIGAIGDPSLSRPHLHYEVRTRYRYEGGPGYTQTNPLELGWLHPVDFTFVARLMVEPAYLSHVTLTEKITLPPVFLATGTTVVAHGARLRGLTAGGQPLWEFDMLGSATALLALPDGRILAVTADSDVLVLNNGSYSALWSTPEPVKAPPVLLGDLIVLMTRENTLLGTTPDGAVLWETPPFSGAIVRWAAVDNRLAIATADRDLAILDQDGQILHTATYPEVPVPFGTPDGGFLVLSGSHIERLDRTLMTLSRVDTGRAVAADAELAVGADGTVYVYPGQGRSLHAYRDDGSLLWIAYMPGSHRRAPALRLDSGRLLYALTADGQLLAYTTNDGRLVGQFELYDGGVEGTPTARWLHVSQDDSVTFSSGYLSTVTLNGLALAED